MILPHSWITPIMVSPFHGTARNALEWNRPLSAGWQALIRGAKDAEQRLMVLRDPKVAEAPQSTGGLKLLPAPGQESTYDLSSAKLFLGES